MKLSLALLVATAATAAVPAAACEHLTEHFTLCAEGTPWAAGTWVNGGDSAALHLGDVSFEGFEDYYSRDTTRPIARDLRQAMARGREYTAARHGTDRFGTDTLQVVRSITTHDYRGDRELRVVMIGEAGGERLLMAVSAPPDMPLDEVDALSRTWAGLIRPKAPQAGN